jgi:solute carrier family 5 (sodium-coupled monocarboxylate transporter), member 8/12
LGYNLVLIEF